MKKKMKKKHVAVYLPEDIAKSIALLAEKDYMSISQFIAKIVVNYVNNKKV